MAAVGKEMNLLVYFKLATLPNLQDDLLKIDEVNGSLIIGIGIL